jgi:hypothetical protein
MPGAVDDLLKAALEQAERSEPQVRGPTLLWIARAQTAFDRERARATFRRGLDEIRSLTGMEREWLLEQACLVAAAVAPDLLNEIRTADRPARPFWSSRIAAIMLDHEHGDAAYEYLVGYDDPSTFPFGAVGALMQWYGDDERRQAVLRSAIAAWMAGTGERFGHQFVGIFRHGWKVLPEDEARHVLREIVRVTQSRPDWPITASYDQERSVQITSGRAHTFFTLLDILRRLDAPLAESLIAQDEQLAAAARRFPNGMESVMEEAERRRASAPPPAAGGGFAMAGNPRDFPYMRSLLQARQDGDFEDAIEHALEQYREDAAPEHPNRVPREFWPSTCRFRSILYSAGKCLGPEGAVYLDLVPDADLRVFAQIEFAAALAGLPELQGTQREYRPQAAPAEGRMQAPYHPVRVPGVSRIRCPQCDWTPGVQDRWSCKCGHRWNTFETGGRCPSCGYQWEVTGCLRCGRSSPHSDWYVRI